MADEKTPTTQATTTATPPPKKSAEPEEVPFHSGQGGCFEMRNGRRVRVVTPPDDGLKNG